MINLREVFEEWRVQDDSGYCEVCHEVNGEDKYSVDGVTICAACLIDAGRWEEFDELPLAVEVAMETLAEESERSLEEVRAMEKELGAYWRATR